jgi:hypothetical protein
MSKKHFQEKKNDKTGRAARAGKAAHLAAEKRLLQHGYIIPRDTTIKEDKQGRDILIEDCANSSGALVSFFEKYGKVISIDAKSAKKKIPKGQTRATTQVSDTWTALELQNVHGGPGWLRPKKADLILFVTNSGDQIVADRQEVLEWLIKNSPVSKLFEKLKKVGWSGLKKGEEYVEYSGDAEYKLYTRRFKYRNQDGSPKEDLLTYVTYEDIKALPSTVILDKKA